MYLKTIPVGSYQANCYILGAEYAMYVAVIDPGAQFNLIHEALETDCKIPSLVLLTHAHPDHYGALAEFKKAYPDAVICMHKADYDIYKNDTLRKTLGLNCDNLPEIDRFIDNGDVLGLGGGVQITVRHTPGHSPGSVCFSSYGMLFTGDTLFKGSIGRTDLIGGDTEQILDSINNVICDYPDEVLVYPGHGPETSMEYERNHNPYLL